MAQNDERDASAPGQRSGNTPERVSGTRRRSKRSDQTKEQIMEAAARVFADYGYDSASLDSIAANAGMTKGTLYYHFDSKEAIYSAVLVRFLGESHDRIVEIAQEDRPMAEIVEAIIDDQLDDTLRPEKRYIHYQEMLRVNDETRLIVREAQRRYEWALADILERGQKTGVVTDGDPRLLALILIGTIGRTARWYRPEGRIPVDEYRETMKRLLLHGYLTDRARNS